jgi:hypothetical protein
MKQCVGVGHWRQTPSSAGNDGLNWARAQQKAPLVRIDPLP